MATLLTVERPDNDGLQPTKTALDAAGHEFKLSYDTEFTIDNGVTALTLTIKTNRTLAGIVLPDDTVAIGANETHVFKRLDPNIFAKANGRIELQYSDVTDGVIWVTE